MIRLDRSVLVTAMILASGEGLAQEQSVDEPDAIVCQLLASCPEAAQPEPEEPTRAKGAPRSSQTRAFSYGRVKPSGAPADSRGTPALDKQLASTKLPSPASQPGQYELRVTFMLGSAEVSPSSRGQVSAFAAALKDPRLAGRRVRIEGHTDSTGNSDANLGLSDRRARAISDMIVAAGIEEARLDVRGYGATRPLPDIPTNAGENRRVIAVLAN